MNLTELETWLAKNPTKDEVLKKLQQFTLERDKLNVQKNKISRNNSNIGLKKYQQKRQLYTNAEHVQMMANDHERRPLLDRINELDKMIKKLNKYEEPKQLSMDFGESIDQLNFKLRQILSANI